MRHLIASSRRAGQIAGRRWIEARDLAVKYVRQGRPLVAIVGRAGCGKTHIMLSMYEELKDYVRSFIDTTTLENRTLSTIAGAVASTQLIINLIKYAKCSRSEDYCKRLREVYSSGVHNLIEYARRWPTDFLRDLTRLSQSRGYKGLIIFIDEGAISSDDPQIPQYIRTLHAFRNICSQIDGLHVVFSILPDVLEYIAKVDVPLMDIIRTGVVYLPDYVERDEIQELAKIYPSREDCLTKLLDNYEMLPPLTVRQVLCLLQECDNPTICGIEESLEVRVEEQQ
ncbi:MAG: ATP-binding protein [Crenarchaeota archaeon]|nr:ATP-binding protein [Thermoproteota archaeon]